MTPGGQTRKRHGSRSNRPHRPGTKPARPFHAAPRHEPLTTESRYHHVFHLIVPQRRYCPETAMRTLCLAIALSLALGAVAAKAR